MATFVGNYNAADPPTDFAPDHLFLLTHEDSSTALMVMVLDSCIIRVDPIPTALIDQLKGGQAWQQTPGGTVLISPAPSVPQRVWA